MYDYWHKQTPDNLLYPEIEWERPERKDLAGRLLIIGGSQNTFLGVAEAYGIAKEYGIGEIRVALPDSLKKLTKDLPDISYAPSNNNGSFSLESYDVLLHLAQWADGILLIGDYGRNSETAVVLANLLRSYRGLAIITKDSIDILHSEMKELVSRQDTLIVCSFSQLQKISKLINDPSPFLFKDDLVRVVEHLHALTLDWGLSIITKHLDFLITSSVGQVVTTERKDLSELWCISMATKASVSLIQHSTKKAIYPLSATLMT